MRRFLLMFSAIALLAGACTSGFGDEGKDLQTISFTADLAAPDQSRTVLVDGKKVYWEAGDEIWVSGADDPFTTELDGPAATAVFTGEAALSDKYYAAYPFSAVKEGTDELLMLSLPSHQIAVNGSFDSGLNLTVASTDDQTRSFRFHNVVGFVKFTIGAAAGEINTVTIRSNAGEALSGDFYVDCESLETVADEDVREYVVLYSSGIFQEGNYYIAMLPGTYEDGLEFIFTGPKGNAVKNVTSSLTLQAGHINDVGTVSSLDWDGEEVFYTKVEQDYDDWSGDYLIAYSTSTSIKVFNSWTGDDKGASTVDLASKMTAEGIPAEDGDVYKAEFRKVGNYYSVYVTGVGYIGCASSSNTVSKQTDAPSESYTKFLWSPTYKNGVWLTNAAYSRRLQWNSDAGIFRCYTGSQKEITLYRRSKSSSGFVPPVPDPDDPTPDPDPDDPQPDDPTPDPDPDEPVPTPVPGTSGKYGWYELPVINYSESGGYLIDDNDKDLYYAHHHCAGNEKGPGGNKARNYTVCFSAKHHCPVWVAAPRHKMYESGASRTDAYAKDPSIPSSIQYNSTKTGGGCNKGNMLGSA